VRRTRIKLKRESILLRDEIDGFFEKVVTRFGNGAKIDCPKEFLGKRVLVIVCKE
jgi:putative transposon-encoded protein